MLVLARREGEKVIISYGGVEVELEVIGINLGVNGRWVQLGFTAPLGVAIHREELVRKVEEDAANSKKTNSNSVQELSEEVGT